MAKKYRDVKRMFRAAGWEHVRTAGSHEIWEHPDRARWLFPVAERTTER